MAMVEDNKIIDINLSELTPKKQFRIDGDNNKILELDVSDIGISKRLKAIYPKLTSLVTDALNIQYDDNLEEVNIDEVADKLDVIDVKMRELLDELFDANVGEVCFVDKHMYSPYNGKFVFEILIETLSKLYENNFNTEFAEMEKRMKKHTANYTKK